MELAAALGLLLTLGLLAGAVFGWISFFRTLRLERQLAALRAEIARLRERAAPPAAQPLPAPQVQPKVRLAPPRPPEPAPAVAPPEPAPAAAPANADGEPAAAHAAARTENRSRNIFEDLEASLSGNWLVWVAGVALALGGVLLAKYALDRGLLGPAARVTVAAAAGFAMLGASEWLRRKGFRQHASISGPLAHSAAPAVTAGAGLVTLYSAVYAAFGLYQLIAGPLAFGLLAAVAAGAAALAVVHGPALVVLGLAGAFLAPLLIGSDAPNAGALFAYVFAVAAVGLAVTRLVGRRWPALAALAGGALWPLLWLAGPYAEEQTWALAIYLPALLAAAIAFAWDQAEHPPQLAGVKARALLADAPVSLAAAYLAALAVFGLQALLLDATGHAPKAVASVAAACALALAAAWRREGLFAAPILALGAAALMLYAWPEARVAVIDADIAVARATGADAGPLGPAYLLTCLGFALLFGVGGLFGQDRLRLKGAMATVCAGAPPLILGIAYLRLPSAAPGPVWGLAAIALAAAYVFLLERQAKAEGGADAAPGPVSAYALGACASAGMAVGMALEQLWMSVGFGALVPVAALLHRRFRIVVLRWAAVAFGLIAAARLIFVPEALGFDVGRIPILNMLVWGYGAPIAAIWAAGRIFMADGAPREGRLVQALNAQALLLAVALASMQIRHLLNGGELDALYLDSLAEAGLQSSAWLVGALLLRWRLGPHLFFVQRWAERLLIGAALAQTALLQLWWINPWWGPWANQLPGPPVWNALLLAYALPAALAAAYAMVARGQGLQRIGTAAGLVGAALAFAWVTLETRHAFHPLWLTPTSPDGALQAVSPPERYAYSTVWLVFAGALLALGAARRRPSMRYAAFGLLVLVTFKVFLDTWGGLEGVLRGLSLIGLGAALMAIAVLYQKLGPKLAR